MFRAYDASRERLVAVKLFKLDLPPERGHQLVAEFERLIAAELTHPAIAALLATGISGVSAYLVQDYVAADSLDLAVREYGPAPAANALRVAAQLAGALDFAAAVHVTHGALHPRDVLLSSDDTRLTGLGVARALERIGVVAPVRRPYSAPERIAGTDWDRRADVFSLAALMHELIWGRRVSGVGPKAVSHLTEIEGADLAALQRVFARALAEQPVNRYGTALEFAEALRLACPDVTIAPEPEPAPKRRVTREEEPRLPLDPPALGEEPRVLRRDGAVETTAETIVAQPVPPPPVDFGELRGGSPMHEPSEGGRPAGSEFQPFTAADLNIAPRDAEPELVYQPAPEFRDEPALVELPTPTPAGGLSGSDADPLSAFEVTRTAVWPLVLALGVGIAIGFAGGFFAGSRERPLPVTAAAAVSPGREFTEAAVPAAAPSNSELKTDSSELKTQSSQPKTANAEPRTTNVEPRTTNVAPSAVAVAGRLLIRSTPAGARVTVDGKDHGVTPATIRDLPRGAHRVKIAHDGYTTEERRVTITTAQPAQSLMVALGRAAAAAPAHGAQAPPAPGRFAGALAVDSRPAGAKVFVDGKLVGTTPMAIPSVAAGSHVVRLEHDGYRRWSSSVRVVASEQNRVTASLER